MSDRVELAFRRVARELIPRDSSVAAAVSGGGDSVALLHLLLKFGRARGNRIAVAHLDHGLRRGSATDRRFVERLAADSGLQCVADRIPVAECRRRGESPEEGARRIRRGFLIRARRQLGVDRIATGHTLDDQAETVLMRLVRGAGATALTGMRISGPGPFIRPLLGIERAELLAYLERRELRYREDRSNRDLRFDRNRTRQLVLPVLAETLNPRVARRLVQFADRLREDALLLDRMAAERLGEIARRDGLGRLSLSTEGLNREQAPVASRVARLALLEAGADPRRVTSSHIEALLRLAAGGGRGPLHLPTRVAVRRRGSWLRFEGSET